ncbi:conserved exported hypothetical protein [Candidatus Terasakiella magnetica]|nr:conserved exported hypothetical protein [Candidatus Terasakiella magnetica]
MGRGGLVLLQIRVIAILSALAALAAGPAFAKGSCATPEQIKAVQFRQLHDELQVAALNCRNDDPTLPGKWTDYVRRFGPALSENAKILTGYFKGTAAFDRHNTKITNRESVRVHETHEGYCEAHAAMFDKVVTLSQPQLLAYASESVGNRHDLTACASGEPKKKATDKKAPKTAKGE